MFNLLGNKKLNPFGLDISDRSIKVMQLGRQKGGLAPLAYGNADLPSNLINNHIITAEDKLATMVQRAMASARGLSGNYAIVSVPEAKSFVRIVTLPKLDISEIATALPWELEQDIPTPIEQVYLDWQVVDQDDEHTRVLAMATPRDYVDGLRDTLKLAGVKAVAMELEPQATARAAISKEDREASVLLVDLASTLTSFTVVSKGVLEYTSSIAVGGNQMTDNIVAGTGMTPKDAEKLKLETGLVTDTKKGNIKQMIETVLDSVIDEIRNVVKYHEDHSLFKQPVSKVILCGGGAKLLGVDDYVAARLNLAAGSSIAHVDLCDPWVNISGKSQRAGFPDELLSQNFTTAIGLALMTYQTDENH